MMDAALAEIAERRRRTARRIVALEGPVCAGKTTVAAGLEFAGAKVVPEYLDLTGGASLAGADAPEAGDGLRRLHLLLELERGRTTHLPPAGTVVLDRSVFTLLAYEAGLSAMPAPNVLAHAVGAVVAAADRGDVALPDRIVFLDCPASLCRERAAAAGMRTPAFLFDARFRGGFRQLFCRLERAVPGMVLFADADCPPVDVITAVRHSLSVY